VSDWGNCSVLQFLAPLTTGMSATVALGQPTTTGGSCLTLGSATATGSGGTCGSAFDSAGNLWVADGDNSRVVKYPHPFTSGEAATVALGQTSTGASQGCNQGGSTWGGPAPSATTLCQPRHIAFDSAGNLWVADTLNNRVLMYPPRIW